jgi:hypothetical protein
MSLSLATYQLGDGVTCNVEVIDRSGSLFDPSEIVLQTKNPNGLEVQITPVKIAVGKYEATFVLDVPGTWVRRWKIFGDVFATDEIKIRCTPTAFVNP